MSKYKMDLVSAWAELDRFADAAGVELDERAGPEFEGEIKDTESEVADYHPLLTALRRGDLEVDDLGGANVKFVRPTGDVNCMALNPETWAYGHATKAMAANNPAKKKKEGDASRFERMNSFLETLSGTPRGTIQSLGHKRDVNLMVHLAAFLLSE
jgi:hypothetical protein